MKEIPLHGKHGVGKVALVDDEDFGLIAHHSWRPLMKHGNCYARATIKGRTVLMHHKIFSPKEGFKIDHRDGNGLNNQRSNLRYATHQQNMCNARTPCRNRRGRFKSVYLQKSGRWTARVGFNGKSIHLGTFDTEVEAAKARDEKAKELHGEFVVLNLPIQP